MNILNMKTHFIMLFKTDNYYHT